MGRTFSEAADRLRSGVRPFCAWIYTTGWRKFLNLHRNTESPQEDIMSTTTAQDLNNQITDIFNDSIGAERFWELREAAQTAWEDRIDDYSPEVDYNEAIVDTFPKLDALLETFGLALSCDDTFAVLSNGDPEYDVRVEFSPNGDLPASSENEWPTPSEIVDNLVKGITALTDDAAIYSRIMDLFEAADHDGALDELYENAEALREAGGVDDVDGPGLIYNDALNDEIFPSVEAMLARYGLTLDTDHAYATLEFADPVSAEVQDDDAYDSEDYVRYINYATDEFRETPWLSPSQIASQIADGIKHLISLKR
jgi:hypothetical protein